MFKYLVAILFIVNSLYAQLPQSIEDFIYKDKIDKNNLSILITEHSTGEVVASLNAYTPRVPASVAKIATTYAALLEFGKNFKWPTQIYYTGSLKRAVLNGDLIVKAYGDPTLNAKDLKAFANKIRSYGIKEISGNLIIDRSFFNNSKKISSGFDKNFVSEYNAMPDALMYNDHLNYIRVAPTSRGVVATRLYGDRGFRLINHIKMVNASCRGRNSWPKVKFIRDNGSVAVELSGTLSKRCRPITIKKVLSKPYVSFYYSFMDYLNKEGTTY